MFAGCVNLWRSLRPVWRRPLAYQPFIILGMLLSTLVWTVAAGVVCLARLVTVIAGETALIGGIMLCLLGFGYVGAPMGVIGLVVSRLAA